MAEYPYYAGEIHTMPNVLDICYDQAKLCVEKGQMELPQPETVCIDQEQFVEDSDSYNLPVQMELPRPEIITVCLDQEEFVEDSDSYNLPDQVELPRPETVTVCVDREEFVEDSDSDKLPVQGLNPLDMDPLSLEHQPILPAVKKEPDVEVHLQNALSNPTGQLYISDETDNVEYRSFCSKLTASNNVSNYNRESVIVPIANGKQKIAELETSSVPAGSSVVKVNAKQVTESVRVLEESQNVQDCSSSKGEKQKNSESETSNTSLVHYEMTVPKKNVEGKLIVVLKRSKVAEKLLCETEGSLNTVEKVMDDVHKRKSDNNKNIVSENSILEDSREQGEKTTESILNEKSTESMKKSNDLDMLAKKMKKLESPNSNSVLQTSDTNTIPGESFETANRCIDCHKIFETYLSWRGHRPVCRERKRKKLLGKKSSQESSQESLQESSQESSRRLRRRCPDAKHSNTRSGVGSHNVYSVFRCQQCKQGFSSGFNLKEHVCVVMEKNPCQCNECPKKFSSSIALKVHQTKMHSQHKNKIPISAKCAKQNMMNEQKKSFPCESCNMVFLRWSALNVHKISHKKPVHQTGELLLLPNSLQKEEMYSKKPSPKNDLKENVSSEKTIHKIPKIESVFNCNICNEVFRTYQELNNHGIVHATKVLQPYLQDTIEFFRRGSGWGCPICPKRRKTKTALKYHMRVHLNIKLFECHVCKKSFSDMYNLRSHEKVHSKDEHRFPCSCCRKVFSSRQHLSEHECSVKQRLAHSSVDKRIHSARTKHSSQKIITDSKYVLKGKWTCSLCGKTLASKHSLTVHTYLHIGKPYKCDICKKGFSSSFWLSNHISTQHRSERPYKCDLCDKTYCRPDSLRCHKAICSQKLAEVEKLQEVKLPSNKKKYSCKHCNSSFITSSALYRHTNFYHGSVSKFLFHSDGRIFQCDICRKTCLTLNSMKRHISTFHEFNAKNDGEEISELQFQSEKRYQCAHCNSTCVTQAALNLHVRRFHEVKKNFQVTGKNVAHSLKLNSVGKRYKCHPCNVTFINRSYLQSHVNVVHRKRKGITSVAESKSSRNIFRCDHCGVKCSGSNNLLTHIRLVHGNNESHFKAKKSLASSVTFNSVKIHKCDKCERIFQDIQQLTRHIKSVHFEMKKRNNSVVVKSTEKTFMCKVCGAMFLQKYKLLKHICNSNMENITSSPVLASKSKLSSKYKTDCKKRCLVCGESFILLDKLKDHMLLHTAQERSYDCRVCHLTFSTSQGLAGHSKCHKQKKKEIGMRSPQITSLKPKNKNNSYQQTSQLLTGHSQSHKQMKGYSDVSSPQIRSLKLNNKKNSHHKYKCDLCDKVLSSSNTLKLHKMLHTGELPYSCQICGLGFRERYKLARHMTNHEMLLLGPT